jgi:electron transfer flavoprotein beta subunit
MQRTDRGPKVRILVCVKQVPDSESTFRVDGDGKGFDEADILFRLNSYDEFAVEEAVQIKEERPGVKITALTVGPGRAEAVVRRALELGADHGVHLVTQSGQGMDSLQTASRIASFAREKDFDLILCGVMSEDEQCCQTGPMVAALLGLPYATTVISEEILEGEQHVRVERELEGGRRQVLELPLPAVLTVQSGINRPRYPSLSNKLRARKQELQRIDSVGMSPHRQGQELVRVFLPPPSNTGVFLEGSLEEKAEALVQIIYEKTDVL